MVEKFPDMEAILAQMNDKFLETAQEKLIRLNEITEIFAQGQGDAALYEEFYRDIHSLKGMGGTFQMPLVTKICHQFEDYLSGVTQMTPQLVEASYAFLDRLNDLIESQEGSNEENAVKWLSGLPQKGAVEQVSEKDSGLSVLIIGKNQDLFDQIGSAFSDSGFDVVTTLSAFRGYKTAATKSFDILVISQDLEEMDGAELVRSLGAMQKFSKVKIAMVCPDRRAALSENLHGVHLLSEKNAAIDVMNFVAIAVTA